MFKTGRIFILFFKVGMGNKLYLTKIFHLIWFHFRKPGFVISLKGATETDFVEIGWWNYMTIASKPHIPFLWRIFFSYVPAHHALWGFEAPFDKTLTNIYALSQLYSTQCANLKTVHSKLEHSWSTLSISIEHMCPFRSVVFTSYLSCKYVAFVHDPETVLASSERLTPFILA